MLQPAEMEWVKVEGQGDVPSPRSGHSLTVTKPGIAYMFGGCTKGAKGPVNEMYKVDTSDKGAAKWKKINTGKMCPNPRWHHTATFDGDSTIIVFGGYSADFR